MKTYQKALLVLFLFCVAGYGIGHGKVFTVSEISYLPTDRSATETPVMDGNQEVCALIKLPFPNVDESVISGDQIFKKEYRGNEWYIYMPPQTYKFFIKYPGYEDLEIDLSKKFSQGVESGKTYRVVIPYNPSELTPIGNRQNGQDLSASKNTSSSHNSTVSNTNRPSPISHTHTTIKKDSPIKRDCFYIQAGYNVLGLSGLNVGVGGYISNINIEADYLLGFSKSEDIYWNNPSGDIRPIKAQYSPMGFNLKLGYGIKLGERFRLTPRTGIQYVLLEEKSDGNIANNAYAIGIPVGIKIDFAIVNHFGIALEPSYNVGISQSDGYKALSDISTKIKGYSEGFGLNISLFCNF